MIAILVVVYTAVCIVVGWELHGMWTERGEPDA